MKGFIEKKVCYLLTSTVVGANLCVPRPLEVKARLSERLGVVAYKEAYAVQTVNIVS
jgi:hypothetical protein